MKYNAQQDYLVSEILNPYNAFLDWLKSNNIKSVKEFTDDPRFSKYRDDAYFLSNLRNLAAHNSLQYVDVLDTAITRINNFVDEITTDSLDKIMIPLKRLYTARMSDKVLPTLRALLEKNFSYLPIINDRKVCEEVFSTYILMSYLSTGRKIEENTTFEDIYNVLDDCTELASTFEFLPIDSSIIQVIKTFKVTSDFHLDVVLVTEDGDYESPLLGMITIWDLQ